MSLNAIGLILNIAGTLLIILFGFPTKIIDERGIASNEEISEIRRKNKQTIQLGILGISLIGLGFFFQLAFQFR